MNKSSSYLLASSHRRYRKGRLTAKPSNCADSKSFKFRKSLQNYHKDPANCSLLQHIFNDSLRKPEVSKETAQRFESNLILNESRPKRKISRRGSVSIEGNYLRSFRYIATAKKKNMKFEGHFVEKRRPKTSNAAYHRVVDARARKLVGKGKGCDLYITQDERRDLEYTAKKYNLIEFDQSIPHVLCVDTCLLYTSPSPRDLSTSRMPSSACKKKKKTKKTQK
eukprot:TRINITY_DN12874_c0_g1_i5.p1 TRINITY_DN12874_c0_g1~~TRINITY_DN12874_c0_g1_i5.p1  ORF type:complete len:254 (-),score=52.86 TRINITY_DN12874_c0_g1_i5:22-690(-)